MKERKLISDEYDDTPVEFNNLTVDNVLSNIVKVSEVISVLREGTRKGELTVGNINTYASLIEYRTKDLLTSVGYDGILAKEIEERHEKIRELNDENRELRKQLGQKVSMEDVREALKLLSKTIGEFTDALGLMHPQELRFSGYSLTFDLSGFIPNRKTYTARNTGLTLAESTGDGYPYLEYSDANLEKLLSLFKARFPSIELMSSSARHYKQFSGPQLDKVTFRITDFDDIPEKVVELQETKNA